MRRRYGRVRIVTIGDQILRLDIAFRDNPIAVVRAGMVHHYGGRMFEAVDEKAGFIVYRETERALDAPQPALLQPVFGAREQGGKHFLTVDGFQKAELAGGITVSFEMKMIDVGGDAADRPITLEREKELTFGMMEKRIFAPIEMNSTFDIQQGDPIWIRGINPWARVRRKADLCADVDTATTSTSRPGAFMFQP